MAAGEASTQELKNMLQRRAERCEKEGAVFESAAVMGSSDAVWSKHKTNQFTPRDVREARPLERLSAQKAAGAPAGATATDEDAASGDESDSGSETDEEDEVEELRRCLQLEREQARAMESRACEAEQIAVWLKEELDRHSGRRPAEEAERPDQACLESSSVDHTRVVKRQMPVQDPEEMRKVLALREELHKLQTHAAKKQEEVLDLTERNQEVQEELEHERQHVLELRRAESDHKRELEEIAGDLKLNEQIKDELKRLRDEAKQLKEKINASRGGEQSLKEEISRLRSQGGADNSPNCAPEEMERMSMTVGGQLVAVERELAGKTKEVSDLADPFLHQMHGLLEAARHACRRLDSGSPGGPREAPELFDPRSRDLRGSLQVMLKLLHYMVEVLSRDRRGDASNRSDWSGSSGPSVAPSRTIPEGDNLRESSNWALHSARQKGSSKGRPKEEEKSGWSKRWTCMLTE